MYGVPLDSVRCRPGARHEGPRTDPESAGRFQVKDDKSTSDSSSSSRRRARRSSRTLATTIVRRPSATSATCPAAPRHRPNTRRNPGRGSVSMTTASSPYLVSPDKKKGKAEALLAMSTSSTSPQTPTARADIAWHLLEVLAEGARAAHGVPRDHQAGDPGPPTTPASSTRTWSTRRRPPHPRPPLRLRGLAGAVEEGHAAAVRRPRAVRGHPRHRRARTRAHGVHPTSYWDLDATLDTGPSPPTQPRASTPPVGRRGQASPPAATSTTAAS